LWKQRRIEKGAGSQWRGYTPHDRVMTCADRWNDWVVTPEGRMGAVYAMQSIRRGE
jgi:hypothetical protein